MFGRKDFHLHKWTITGTNYTAPRASMMGKSEGEVALKLLHDHLDKCRRGETHIYMRCNNCGDVKCETVPGEWKMNTFLESARDAANGR